MKIVDTTTRAGYRKRCRGEKESMQALELTKELIARSRVIAKGRGIRDLKRLVQDYGVYEYHWYEHHGIGRFEIKIKKVRNL